jgi:tetratricopeptide (TPR) repeat protein
VEAITAIAQIYVAQGKTNLAVERVTRQLNRVKSPAPLYQLLGQLKLGERDSAQAIVHFQKALEVDPNLVSAYQFLGNAQLDQQKFDAAIESYQKVLAKNPQALPTYLFLGVAHERKQQFDKANEFYEKALDINKDFAPAANNLAWNYAEHGGNLDTALALAQKAVAVNPGNPVMADTLGWIYYKKGAYGTAIGYLKDSNAKFKEQNAGVLYHLGLAYQRNGDKALAREKLTKALALDGSAPEAKAARDALAALN